MNDTSSMRIMMIPLMNNVEEHSKLVSPYWNRVWYRTASKSITTMYIGSMHKTLQPGLYKSTSFPKREILSIIRDNHKWVILYWIYPHVPSNHVSTTFSGEHTTFPWITFWGSPNKHWSLRSRVHLLLSSAGETNLELQHPASFRSVRIPSSP